MREHTERDSETPLPGERQILPSELTDDHRITRIIDGRFTKSESYFWDESYGQLYAYVETLGIVGYVRAQTWESAYECVQDEIMYDGDESDAIDGLTAEQIEQGELVEGYGFRSNGVPSNPHRTSHLYAEDLNGSALTAVTDEYAAEHGIMIFVEVDESDESESESDESRRNPLYDKLAEHIGHAIVVVTYGDGENVAVECTDCCTVLVDADRYDESDESEPAESESEQ